MSGFLKLSETIRAVGSGADGYVAFFTGSNAIAGDNDLYFDRVTQQLKLGANLELTNGRLVLPQVNDASSPTIQFGAVGTGFYASAAGALNISILGGNKVFISSSQMRSTASGAWNLLNEAASSINPVFAFQNDANTGLGLAALGQMSLISDGLELMRMTGDGAGGGTVDAYGDLQAQSNLRISGQTYNPIPATLTPTGTTQTINWHDGNSQILDLESASGTVTLTLSNPQSGASYIIKVIQDSASPIDITWPAAVKWVNGVTPVISTGADVEDVVSLWYDGTSYYANIGPTYS